MNTKKVLLIDMDEVLANFTSSPRLRTWDRITSPNEMYESGFFEELEPMEGAIQAIQELIQSDMYDIYICTQPLAKSINSYTEKAAWIAKYLPDLIDKIIMTQNKNMIKADILIDDNKTWKDFGGEFIYFTPEIPSDIVWKHIVDSLLWRNFNKKVDIIS